TMPGAPPSPAKPRMVVVGNAVWVSNPYVDEARATEPNFDLFVGLLDWLRERPSNIGIEPRPYKNYLLDRSASFVRLALLPALVVAGVSLMTGPKAADEGLLLAKLRAQNVTAKDITRVTVERKQPTEQKLVFVRVDKDRWKLEEPYPAQVDGSMVERIVSD